MLVLFLGIAAVVGTVVFGAYSGDSWLRFSEGLGETWLDSPKTVRVDRIGTGASAQAWPEQPSPPEQGLPGSPSVPAGQAGRITEAD